jgi:hypothetical protein
MQQHVRRDLRHRHPAIAHDHDRLLIRALLDRVADAGHRELHQRRADVLTDEPLRRVNHVMRFGQPVPLRLGSDHHAAGRRKRDHRWMDALTAWAEDELHTRRGGDGRHRVGRSEIETKGYPHGLQCYAETAAHVEELGSQWGRYAYGRRAIRAWQAS